MNHDVLVSLCSRVLRHTTLCRAAAGARGLTEATISFLHREETVGGFIRQSQHIQETILL